MDRGRAEALPGEPKPGYVALWEDTPEWERQAAGAVYEQVHQFLALSDGSAARLSREQKGRFVAISWTEQMYKHFGDPKPAYVADWPDLPDWQKETGSDIFEAIEDSLEQCPASSRPTGAFLCFVKSYGHALPGEHSHSPDTQCVA